MEKTLKEQAVIVEQRLWYHFAGTKGELNAPAGLPFMKEFLAEVDRLVALAKRSDESAALPLHIVNRSVLRKFLVGENVKCTFYNSGNKFWSKLLENNTKIEGIRDDGKTGISELQLGGEWFYENDFVRV